MTSGHSSAFRQIRSRLWRASKWLMVALALVIAAGAIYQFSMGQWESHRYPAPRKLVDIGGLRLHINCMGAGSPAVLLEAGPNDSSLIWQLAQPEISKFTRVCSYDRAGFGWSDAPNEPRSSSNIADELEPFSPMLESPDLTSWLGTTSAHSTSTCSPRAIASKLRAWCSSTPSIPTCTIARRSMSPRNPRPVTLFTALCRGENEIAATPAENSGRSYERDPNQPAEWARLVPEAAAQYCRLQSLRTEQAQVTDEDGSFSATTGPFGDIPLVVLSHDPQVNDFGGFFSPDNLVKAERAWMEMQGELRAPSLRSQWIIAKGSPHWIQIHRPELVAATVQEIVNDSRGSTPFRAAPEAEYK
jgi:hypothetical protein